jgi:hypothetical protein
LRAAAFGTVLTSSAVLAHALAGGMVPRLPIIALAVVVLCCAGWLLSGRDRPPLAVGAAAMAGQVALHVTFSLTMPGSMGMSSLLCGQPAAGCSPAAAPGVVQLRIMPLGSPATSHQMLLMMAAHAVGGVIVLLGLRSAESVAVAIAGLLSTVLLWALPALSRAPRRHVRPAHRACRLSSMDLFAASPRRGPPAFACS